SHWHPDALRDTARARRAVAEALVGDARFRAEVAEATANEEERARAASTDPLTLREEVGGEQAIALLAVAGRWDDLAELAEVLAAEETAARGLRTAPPETDARLAALQDQVRALQRRVQQAQRR